jgi:hypothetical protein
MYLFNLRPMVYIILISQKIKNSLVEKIMHSFLCTQSDRYLFSIMDFSKKLKRCIKLYFIGKISDGCISFNILVKVSPFVFLVFTLIRHLMCAEILFSFQNICVCLNNFYLLIIPFPISRPIHCCSTHSKRSTNLSMQL